MSLRTLGEETQLRLVEFLRSPEVSRVEFLPILRRAHRLTGELQYPDGIRSVFIPHDLSPWRRHYVARSRSLHVPQVDQVPSTQTTQPTAPASRQDCGRLSALPNLPHQYRRAYASPLCRGGWLQGLFFRVR